MSAAVGLAALALAAVLALGLTACDSLPDSGGHTVNEVHLKGLT